MPRVSCRPTFVPPDLTIGSLFAGIGGIELGLEWSGVGRTIWQVEKDAFCRQVLAKWWPNVSRFEDVKSVGSHNLPAADLLCGGPPCQDISYAGKGAGLAGERSGLWFEYERIIREMGPRFVVVENVAALRSRGLDVVLGALASLGYDAEWRSVQASDVGAPHRRERVFIVAWLADSNETGRRRQRIGGVFDGKWKTFWDDAYGRSGSWDSMLGSCAQSVEERGRQKSEPILGRGSHGIPDRLDRWPSRPGEAQHEWEPPRAIQTGEVSARAPRLKALGNAVVPQVVADFVAPIIFRVLREQG